MKTKITLSKSFPQKLVSDSLFLIKDEKDLKNVDLTGEETKYVLKKFNRKKTKLFQINRYGYWVFVQYVKEEKRKNKALENFRIAGDDFVNILKENKITNLQIRDYRKEPEYILAFLEGLLLGSYEFGKYKTKPNEEKFELKTIVLNSLNVKEGMIRELKTIVKSVFFCRDLVNEPVSYLNATRLSEAIREMAEPLGINVDIFNRKKIEALKMGGLLAVNKGSIDPPTFTTLEWSPPNAINDKPYVLVGKGIVYDTGGLNIKVGNYMENMKCDMSGAAMMAAVMCAIAMNKIPIYTIALIPATDNRPDGNAYVSGDVIKMHNGLTVEVINTDAEGRLILADAISYAKKYDPTLIIDSATLTGAAERAIGRYGIVGMERDAKEEMEQLKISGEEVYERIAEFPFWEEYDELIKSEIADMKNIGGVNAGMITAGKFLARFTDFSFIHLDIAGPAFLDKKDHYRTLGGSGVGVRLLYTYFKNKTTTE